MRAVSLRPTLKRSNPSRPPPSRKYASWPGAEDASPAPLQYNSPLDSPPSALNLAPLQPDPTLQPIDDGGERLILRRCLAPALAPAAFVPHPAASAAGGAPAPPVLPPPPRRRPLATLTTLVLE
jgi:hypothetical protein